MLSLFKKPFLILLVLAAVGGGVYFFQKKNGQVLGQQTEIGKYVEENFPAFNEAIKKLPFTSRVLVDPSSPSATTSTSSEDFVNNSLTATSQQLEVLGQNGNKVKDQLTEFVSQIKESTQSTPLHEKAFEYGQYMYCQQVIKEYEN